MRHWVLACLLFSGPALAQDAKERIQFWNTTTSTIIHLVMAPAGTQEFGPDQCLNDRDGEVSHDERLRLTGVTPGRYDIRLQTKAGKTCLIRNVAVATTRVAFTLADADLTDCH